MKPLLFLLVPVALLLAYGVGVLFWAAVSQIRAWDFFRHRDDSPPGLGLVGWLRFYQETLAGAYKLLWWSVRAAFQAGIRQPSGPKTGRTVLCIHGLFMNSSCMWGIRRHLESIGRPTRGVFMGLPLPTPMAYVGPLTRVMRELAEECREEGFDIVAHSIGGVMIREVLHRQPELAQGIRRVVTLGSPHHGTAVLRWIKHGPIYKMLSLDSRYLRELDDLQVLAPQTDTTTVGSQHDLVVYPVETCHLDGARPVTLETISHLGLMTEKRILIEIEAGLAVPPPRLESSGSMR